MSTDAFQTAAVPAAPIPHDIKDAETIAIIGGGMSGKVYSVATLSYLERDIERASIEELRALGDIRIVMYDKKESPYDHDKCIFFLNQPASRMSIFPDKERENDFVKWLSERRAEMPNIHSSHAHVEYERLRSSKPDPFSHERIAYEQPELYEANFFRRLDEGVSEDDTYAPRAIYGRYLKQRTEEATIVQLGRINKLLQEADATARIHFENINEYVADFNKDGERVRVLSRKDATSPAKPGITCDRLILATGHVESNILQECQTKNGYADTPFTVDEIRLAVENQKKTITEEKPKGEPILLAGTGQASLDALGVLSALNYQGEIIMVSGENIEPWPQDHKLSRTPVPNFAYQHDLLLKLKNCADSGMSENEAYRAFAKDFQDMMHCDPMIACGPNHLIQSFLAEDMRDQLKGTCNCYGDGFVDQIISLVNKHDNNSTAPDKYAMYLQFKNSGQLKLQIGRIDGQAQIVENENVNSFTVSIKDPATKETTVIQAGAILNSASMSKAALRRDGQAINPLIGKLIELNILKPCPIEAGAVTPVNRETTVLIGVADGEGPFGVPYNKDEIWEKAFGITGGIEAENRHQITADLRKDFA